MARISKMRLERVPGLPTFLDQTSKMNLLACDELLRIRAEQARLINVLDTTYGDWKKAPTEAQQQVKDLHNDYQSAYGIEYKRVSFDVADRLITI